MSKHSRCWWPGLALLALSSTAAAETKDEHHARFRFGVAGGPGLIAGSRTLLGYGGFDLRLGMQLNQQVGLYVQPQLGLYGGDAGNTSGVGGVAGVSGLVDVMLTDELFVAGGAGYAVLTSLAGPELHLRFGGYPVLRGGSAGARRKALMLGVDLRVYFLDVAAFVAPTFNVGFETF